MVQDGDKFKNKDVGGDESGHRGFDDIGGALLTMFVHMGGDRGMSDMPDAIVDTTMVSKWAVWLFFAAAAILLTWVCMNLVLAVTLGAFQAANTILLEEKASKDKIKARKKAMEQSDGNEKDPFSAVADAAMDALDDLLDFELEDFQEERRRTNEEVNAIDYGDHAAGQLRNAAKGFVTSHVWGDLVAFAAAIYIWLLASRADDLDDETLRLLNLGEDVLLGVFAMELLVRLAGLGFKIFFRTQENVVDLLIYAMTVVGTVATNMSGTAMAIDNPVLFTWLRLLRVIQVVRVLYKVPSIYRIMTQVMKSWKPLLGCMLFLMFSVMMGAVIGMHVLGGGLGLLNPADRDSEALRALGPYPRRNFETFPTACLACLQVMLANNWSDIMLWYMTYGGVGSWAALFFPLLYLWSYGILFNAFVSVLLINFATEEADKIPLQRRLFWTQEADLDIDETEEEQFLDMIIAKETSREVVDDDSAADGASEPNSPRVCKAPARTHPQAPHCRQLDPCVRCACAARRRGDG
eukprot:SAG11_NODE_1901_length_4091_cov_1.742485_1_plen_522_part_00